MRLFFHGMDSKLWWAPSCIAYVQNHSMGTLTVPDQALGLLHSRFFSPKWLIYPSQRLASKLGNGGIVRPLQIRGKWRACAGSDSDATVMIKDRGKPFAMGQSTRLVSSIGTQPAPLASLKDWKITDRHFLVLAVISCVIGGAVASLFVAAIPTMLAFKKAAESLEKLLDVTREELPGTMAAVRLSGMEIGDLTMELSEMGQEITEGVRSSARAVRAAEDGLRRMSNLPYIALFQGHTPRQVVKPAIALETRSLCEQLVQTRSFFHGIMAVKRLTGWISRYWMRRRMNLRRASFRT
eukprot:c18376_g1_i2 orf=145-1032(-)